MSAKRKNAWYGVRTLYRLTAKGRPKSRDKYYDRDSTLVEDRIVLFQANRFDDALAQGEKEARSYCRRTRFVNIYGQQVRMRYLDACDAFEIFDKKIAAGSEVYSSTELVGASVRDSALIASHFREDASARGPRRHKFIDGNILRDIFAAGYQPSE